MVNIFINKITTFYNYNYFRTSFDSHPRLVYDIDGDRKADIIGFYTNGVNIVFG